MLSALRRPLVLWSAVVLALLAAHDLSHALDSGLNTSLGALAVIAVPQWIVLVVVMGVIVRGDPRRSALAALALSAGVIGGFAAVHLLPFSPAAYWDLHPSAVSWLLVWAPLVAGLVLARIAWQEWRAHYRDPEAQEPQEEEALNPPHRHRKLVT
jgi:hypothetical protein